MIAHLAMLDLAIRRFEEAEVVDAGESRQRRDEADVRTFRRFDRTNAAVVGRMNVAHFETGAVARETARSEGRETALVREFGQRIDLVHKLRELAATEKVADNS